MSRAIFLKDIEKSIQKKWNKNSYEQNAPDNFDPGNKNKFFVTFPFPYVNGRLHLGHVFTMLKADIMARYYRIKGYNVLFPFGFHGTGIPIPVSAKKIKDEYDNNLIDHTQISIMKKMGINETEISKFVDPKYWLEFFPNISILNDLPLLGCSIDYRRSFVTTDFNPYFDSFVKWQFNILKSKGFLDFGKKMVIYSEKDGQPCSDADRSIGEGVGIKEYLVAPVFLQEGTFMATFHSEAPIDSFVVSNSFECYNCTFIDELMSAAEVYCPEYFYRNYVVQQSDCFILTSIGKNKKTLTRLPLTKWSHASGIYTSNPNLKWQKYYEPESEVISRSGDKCIATQTDQWYIRYDDPEWQKSVYEYVEHDLIFTDPVVKDLMLNAIKNSHPWPFSRTYGLGTKIPFDEKYLIDSLSDSTIYMAFYTISHLITQLPVNDLSDGVWDCIFYGINSGIYDKHPELFNRMRNEFNYWYPLDLRVSGKDLITNHLVMMLFNHMAIFGKNLMPKMVYANGHIMVNGEKMSKSMGNFITLDEAINKYGTNVIRLIISTAGDDSNDGNFNEAEVGNAVLSMYAEILIWNKMDNDKYKFRTGNLEIIDTIQLIKLNKILNHVQSAYRDMRFRDVVKYGFYELQTIRNKYQNPHIEVYKLMQQLELFSMHPIIPYWTQFLSDEYGVPIKMPLINIASDNVCQLEWLDEYFQIIYPKIANKIKKLRKKKIFKCKIIINNSIKKYLDKILEYNTNNKIDRKNLISSFSDPKENKLVIELVTHLDSKDDNTKKLIIGWLQNQYITELSSYLRIVLPEYEFSIVYDDKAHSSLFNPIFE